MSGPTPEDGSELADDLAEGLAQARAGNTVPAHAIAEDLQRRREAGEAPAGDLLPWLRAQIAETKRVALATITAQSDWGGWSARHFPGDYGFSEVVQTGRVYVVLSEVTPETADHIALNDPANALAQCEAFTALLDAYENAEARRVRLTEAFTRNLRAIAELDPHEERRRYSEVSTANGVATGYGMAVRLAASCYRHHPGYRSVWRP